MNTKKKPFNSILHEKGGNLECFLSLFPMDEFVLICVYLFDEEN